MTTHADTFFLDPAQACEVALQRNRVPLTPAISGLQLCYYSGEVQLPDTPENMVYVKDILSFFATTRHRIPTNIVFPNGTPQTDRSRIVEEFKKLLMQATDRRRSKIARLREKCRGVYEAPEPGEPLRIWCPTSRLTTVLQYSSRGLARAFARLGHNARLFVEENDMQHHDDLWQLRDYYEFKPHMCISLNHLHNSWLHPDIINVTWWQDNMTEIQTGDALPWRENDWAYSYSKRNRDLLRATGVPNPQMQLFCVDEEIFHPRPDIERENKIVFAGSSYARSITSDAHVNAVAELYFMVCDRVPIDHSVLMQVANKHGIGESEAMFALNYVVRDKMIEAFCQQDRIGVEIYGRFWDENPVIAPFYRGEIPHGEELARIYCSARYSISGIALQTQTQRLAEIGACGCIPLVFDFRHCAEPPFWEDECIFFQSPSAILDVLGQEKETYPERFIQHYSYLDFARRILRDVGLEDWVDKT